MSEAQTDRFLNFMRQLPIDMDRDPDEALVLGLAGPTGFRSMTPFI
jgi:hypothetical protein